MLGGLIDDASVSHFWHQAEEINSAARSCCGKAMLRCLALYQSWQGVAYLISLP